MRTHNHLYAALAREKLDSEKETQETPVVRVSETAPRKQSIPNAAAIRRSHRDPVLSRTLEFENV